MSSIGGLSSGLSQTGISFGGLASGLDTNAIIQALLAVEQRPITALQNKRASIENQKSLFGDLEDRLKTLRDKADAVRQSSNFLEFQATVEDETYFSASASTSAVAGTYDITVNSLAQAQVNQSNLDYAAGATISGANGQKLVLTVGSQSPVEISLENETYTLDELADTINAQNAGVTAQVLQVKSGEYELVLNGEVGSDNSFTITTQNPTTGSGSLDELVTSLNANQTNAADASLTVNNVTITRSSNQITDAITGVTLDLHALHTGSPSSTKLTVSPDTTATGDKVQGFVDAYNSVVDFLQSQQVFDPENSANTSPLFGDSTLFSVGSGLRSILGSSVSTGNTSYELLSQVGIESDRDGRLTFTRSEFDAAVTDDADAVEKLFTDTTSGIASQLYSQTDDYLNTVDGLLVTRQKGYDTRIKDLDDQIRQAERRLSQTQQSLEQKYANLEVLLGRLQSQGSSLGSLGGSSK